MSKNRERGLSREKSRGSASASRRRDGFTLIELLVVIAIIGVLSSVVLASLNSARGKGNDAKVKSELSSLRGSAEICYSNASPNSYTDMCTVADGDPSGLDEYLDWTNNYPAGVTGECYSSATTYKVFAPLPFQGGFWCVDSYGASKYEADEPANDSTRCS